MNKFKLAVASGLSVIGSTLFALSCRAESYLNASDTALINNAFSQGATDVRTTLVTNVLPYAIGVGILIIALGVGWRIFKRFVGGR